MSAAARFLRRRLERGAPYGLALTAAFGAVALAVAAFVAVAEAVASGGDIARFDAAAHAVVFELFGANPALGAAVTWFGNNATLTGLVVAVSLALAVTRRYWAAFRVALASGVGGVVVVSLKALFARERPLDKLIEAGGYSFPSGHAFASTVFYGMMLYLVWRLTERAWARALAAVAFPLLIAAVGLSRVYLNVHYLTDVLAGWLAGAAWLVAVLAAVRVVELRTRSRAERAEERARPDDVPPEAAPPPRGPAPSA